MKSRRTTPRPAIFASEALEARRLLTAVTLTLDPAQSHVSIVGNELRDLDQGLYNTPYDGVTDATLTGTMQADVTTSSLSILGSTMTPGTQLDWLSELQATIFQMSYPGMSLGVTGNKAVSGGSFAAGGLLGTLKAGNANFWWDDDPSTLTATSLTGETAALSAGTGSLSIVGSAVTLTIPLDVTFPVGFTAPATTGVASFNAMNNLVLHGTIVATGTLPATTGSVAGRVYDDANGNAFVDVGELGINARTVFADKDGDGVLDAGEPSTTTNASGDYVLASLTPGSYTIRQVLPSGWRQTVPAAGSGYSVAVTSGSTFTGRSFAATQTATIRGTVSNDANANGTVDGTEVGLAGWRVYVDANNDGAYQSNETSAITDATGAYTLTVAAGTHVVRQVLAYGWRVTSPQSGVRSVTVGSAGSATGASFADTQRGLLTGTLYHDSNLNGLKDSTEAPLAGWRVYVDANRDGVRQSSETSAVTDTNGNYSMSADAGYQRVGEVLATGWQPTSPSSGYREAYVYSGEVVTDLSFGNAQRGMVLGNVFDDRDANGLRNSVDPALKGWRVFIDMNNDRVYQSTEPTSVTDAKGNYKFVVIPGKYRIREVIPTGWRISAPAVTGYHDVTVVAAQTLTSRSFGNTTTVAISGVVFYDANHDGIQQISETGWSGWRVFIDGNHDGKFDAWEKNVYSGSGGSWTLDGLNAGTYDIRIVRYTYYKQSTPAKGFHVTLASGAVKRGLAFGLY